MEKYYLRTYKDFELTELYKVESKITHIAISNRHFTVYSDFFMNELIEKEITELYKEVSEAVYMAYTSELKQLF